MQIDIFSGASPKAYRTVIPSEVLLVISNFRPTLLEQNTVSPIKCMTFHHLELMDTIIVARMSNCLKNVIKFYSSDIYT